MNSFQIRGFFSIVLLITFCSAIGCSPPGQVAEKEDKKEKREPIIGKVTQEIGEWDPNAERQLREEGGDKVNMVNRNFQAMSYALHETARLQVKQGLNYFNATEGRYPKSHEEFMEKVIKFYNIKLPKPVATAEYQYDVENHELLVVEKQR